MKKKKPAALYDAAASRVKPTTAHNTILISLLLLLLLLLLFTKINKFIITRWDVIECGAHHARAPHTIVIKPLPTPRDCQRVMYTTIFIYTRIFFFFTSRLKLPFGFFFVCLRK